MKESWLAFLLKKLKRAVSRLSFIFSFRFFSFILALSAVYFWLALRGVRTESQVRIEKLKEDVAYHRSQSEEWRKRYQEKERKTNRQLTQDPLGYVRFCDPAEDTIFTKDKRFAACLVDDEYHIYHKCEDCMEYVILSEETGRINNNDDLFISYSAYDRDIGTRVFQLNPKLESLDAILDSSSVPNKEIIVGDNRFSLNYRVWSDDEGFQFSPDRRYLLLFIHDCWGCSARTWLYAYDFFEKDLQYIGTPYISENKISIKWLTGNTLRWREGRWRKTTDEGYEAGYDFPYIQDDLGYKRTSL